MGNLFIRDLKEEGQRAVVCNNIYCVHKHLVSMKSILLNTTRLFFFFCLYDLFLFPVFFVNFQRCIKVSNFRGKKNSRVLRICFEFANLNSREILNLFIIAKLKFKVLLRKSILFLIFSILYNEEFLN